jgi:CRISPR-associated protein Cas5d
LSTLSLRCWGEYALFTRPEFKVERISYDAPTPSAAEGILKAIFWKPEFDWVIEQIWILKPIQHYLSIVRNEVKLTQSISRDGFIASEERTQRHSLLLRDIEYIITAHIELKPHADKPLRAYEDQFNRRVDKGQYFQHPYFGCQEFPAYFEKPNGDETPIDYSVNLGQTLTKIKYVPDPGGPITFKVKDQSGVKIITGRAIPEFQDLKIEKGIIYVP